MNQERSTGSVPVRSVIGAGGTIHFRNIPRPSKLTAYIAGVVLLLVVTVFAFRHRASAQMDAITANIKATTKADSVVLVRQGASKFTGVVTFKEAATTEAYKVTVATDGDRYVWELEKSPAEAGGAAFK